MKIWRTKIKVTESSEIIPKQFLGKTGIIVTRYRQMNPIETAILDDGEIAYLRQGEYAVLSQVGKRASLHG